MGHLGHLIEQYFEDGSKWDVNIKYIYENQPLGSAGALYYAKDIIGKRDVILVLEMLCLKLTGNDTFVFTKNIMVK